MGYQPNCASYDENLGCSDFELTNKDPKFKREMWSGGKIGQWLHSCCKFSDGNVFSQSDCGNNDFVTTTDWRPDPNVSATRKLMNTTLPECAESCKLKSDDDCIMFDWLEDQRKCTQYQAVAVSSHEEKSGIIGKRCILYIEIRRLNKFDHGGRTCKPNYEVGELDCKNNSSLLGRKPDG